MKPSIRIWIYLGLLFLLTENLPSIASYFQLTTLEHDRQVIFPIIPMVISSVSIITIFGLIKRQSWSRISAFIVILFSIITKLSILIHISPILDNINSDMLQGLIIIPLVTGVLLLILAYKILSSKSLKKYLSLN